MVKYNVIVKAYDEDEYEELITKEPVSHGQAVAIDRGLEMNLNHNDYYTVVEEVK